MRYPHYFMYLLFLLHPLTKSHALQPLTIRNGKFFSGDNQFTFKGLNWFGFNNQQTMLDGLWVGGNSSATDFSSIVYKIKLLGFNSVRLPFLFSDLYDIHPQSKSIGCHIDSRREICDLAHYRESPPAYYGPWPVKNKCNDYLPSGSTLQRFYWVITQFIKNEFYVVIDYHPTNPALVHDTNQLVFQWRKLWTYITQQPDFQFVKGRLILDLINEPDCASLHWQRTSAKNIPSATETYIALMDSLYRVSNPLFLIEGTGQTGYNLCWGNGFVTNKSIVDQHNIDDASVFFETLIKKPYLTNVIISPHLYGPTISKDTVYYYGAGVRERFFNSFGYLGLNGYCSKKQKPMGCYMFPILIGEFGSFFQDPRDMTFLNELAQWLNKNFKGNVNWMFWAYNANSGDTGGIVTDDWKGLNWKKLDWLKRNMGL